MYFPYDSPCNVQPTMAELISVHLVAMATRLDHMERSLEWILPTVISLMKDPVTTDWEDEIHSREEGDFAEQRLKLEITDLLKKLESFSWPEHIEIASIMHKLHLMQEEVDQNDWVEI